jgi:hypothetical protein
MKRSKFLGGAAALALVAAAGIGAVSPVLASTPTQIVISGRPLNGALHLGATWTYCVQGIESGTAVAGADVYLSFDNQSFGVSTDVPVGDHTTPGPAGFAEVGATALTASGVDFTTPATPCSPSSGGSALPDAITVTYTSPDYSSANNGAPYPIWGGRDFITAQDNPTSPTITINAVYQFSPVDYYVWSGGSSIAPTGSLSAGQAVPITLTTEDTNGNPVGCASVLLSLSDTASPSGSVTSEGLTVGSALTRVITTGTSAAVCPVTSGTLGQVAITYTAASSGASDDTLTAQNHPTIITITTSTSYDIGGGYTVDVYGGLHPFGDAPYEAAGAYYPGFNIVRGLTLNACDPSGHSGWTVDGYGGMHPFGGAPYVSVYGGYYPGFDIIRGAVAWCDQGQAVGYTVDAYGGMHPFSSDPAGVEPVYPQITGYWSGQQLTAGIVLIPGTDEGYVADAYGGLHPFNGAPYEAVSAYYPGFNIIRGVTLTPGGGGGYTVDAYGGLHPFGSAGYEPASAYYSGWDIMRGVVATSATGGYTLDAYGGLHPYGTAPYFTVSGYYPGQYLVNGVVSGG